jgi:hypothetical protein
MVYGVHICVLIAYLTLDPHYLAAITGLGQMLNSGQAHREPHRLFSKKELRPLEKLLLALSEINCRGRNTRMLHQDKSGT